MNDIHAMQLARDIADYVNRGGSTKEFIKEMADQHPTLQQRFTAMCLTWFEHLTDPKRYTDARSEHSVVVAKKIRKLLEEEYGSAWTHMPCI